MHDVRVEVTPRLDGQAVDVRGNVVKARLLQDLNLNVERVRSICGFVVRSPWTPRHWASAWTTSSSTPSSRWAVSVRRG